MPNLRLSREDALDIAEYLATLKAPADFEKAALPPSDPATLEKIGLYFEMATRTIFDAKADLASMDIHKQEVYVGRNLIAYYGCFACHAIPGFEDAKPIGTELTEEGSKPVHRLDFGFLHLPHTRQDWFRTKLTNPRIFDRDRARGWEEKLKMPNFRFSPRELDYVVTAALLGFQKLNASDAAVKRLSPSEEAIEHGPAHRQGPQLPGLPRHRGHRRLDPLDHGRRLARAADHPGAGRQGAERLAVRVPEGAEDRARSGRGSTVHMPTFGFTDRELNDLTKYFASLDRATLSRSSRPTTRQTRRPGRRARRPSSCCSARKCHPRSLEEMNRPGVDRATLAPNLQMASTRLRHDWINDWIRRPDEWMPGTRMPTNFPKGDDGQAHLAAGDGRRLARVRQGPRGLRQDPGRRRQGEGLPRRPGRRHEGPARLRLVDRQNRRLGPRARPGRHRQPLGGPPDAPRPLLRALLGQPRHLRPGRRGVSLADAGAFEVAESALVRPSR